jgi:putative membrane protein
VVTVFATAIASVSASDFIFAQWSPPWLLSATLLVTAIIYTRGWFAIRRTRPALFPTWRLVLFLSGIGSLWLALGSPLDGFADALLSAHMVQHLLLMSVVPPLILLGLPVVPLLRGLPKSFVRRILGPIFVSKEVKAIGRFITRPVVAWLLMNVSFLAWHTPAAYDYALWNEPWHRVEHLCFLLTSLLFWWPVIQPWPARRHDFGWGILLYLVTADFVNTALSAFLAFCDRPVYQYYVVRPNAFHVNPVTDQATGGAIMWVLGSFVFLMPAVGTTLRLLQGETPSRRHTTIARARPQG